MILVIDGSDISNLRLLYYSSLSSNEIALKWLSLDLTDDKSTLVQKMIWFHQATDDYPN